MFSFFKNHLIVFFKPSSNFTFGLNLVNSLIKELSQLSFETSESLGLILSLLILMDLIDQ